MSVEDEVEFRRPVDTEVPSDPGSVIAVDDPATGAVVGHVEDVDALRVAEAVRRGRQAQPACAALGYRARSDRFRAARRWFPEHAG